MPPKFHSLGIYPRETSMSAWTLCKNIYSSFIHKNQNLEITQMFING